ncbi:MAG: response regulator, partial [Duncaniella sp.]|nr:response regulator [Duncaniella sp.]
MRRLLDIEHIDVEPDKRNLSLYFAALDYSNNYLLRYAYKFDSESDWTYLHNNHAVHLNNLSPGKHRLLVRSTNGDGVWVDNESVVELNVIPVFWETAWAKVLYILIVGFILWVALYFYFMKRKNRLLNEMREQEAKFYSDVSHKLRTPLTLIGSPVSEVLRTESLSDTARNHLERVERNSANMLSLVDTMIKKNYDGGDVYISDSNVPVCDNSSRNFSDEAHSGVCVTDVKDSKELLLVVEDNDDLRSFLYDILSSQYHVALAANGKLGLEKAAELQPDFIITDVTMPEMDGLTMVHNIKQNKSLSHIPILVLSAKASEQDRIKGLKEGIDDYITKPFSATYLRQRIASIIAQRRILQQAYLESLNNKFLPATIIVDADDVTVETEMADSNSGCDVGVEMTPEDKALIDRLLEFMYSRIEDENLRIEDLADAVGLG